MSDFHSHKCDTCGAQWDHERLEGVTEKRYEEVHTCPTPGCGKVQYYKYFGPGSVQTQEQARAKAFSPFNQLMAFLSEADLNDDDGEGDRGDYA